MVRVPGLSPYHARFQVPLDFSKYDLRDYLYHAYNVRCFNVRSNVKQMPVRDTQSQQRHWFRAESKKYMTVEMEQPFVWPETPDMAPWGNSDRRQEIKDNKWANGVRDTEIKREEARALRDHVKTLLSKNEPETDYAIQRKIKEGRALSPEEQERSQLTERRKAELNKMTPLELWEQQRTQKVVQSGRGGGFAIKV
jgi:large subunit ribosomal protein L23